MKTKMHIFNRVSALVLATALLLAGCSGGSEAVPTTPTPTSGKGETVVTFSRPEDLLNLDPHDHTHISCFIVNRCIYDTLLELDADGKIIPGMATEWKLSNNDKTLTFTLRDDITFHNGELFNAECVKISIDRILTEKLRFLSNFSLVESVEILGDYEVAFNLKSPDAAILNSITITPIIPAKAYAEKGNALFEHPIGSGPFKFVEWLPKQKLTMVKNESYWGTPANVDRLIYLPLTEDSTRVAALQTGEIDVAVVVPPDQVEVLSANKDLTIERVPAWDQTFIMFKCDEGPFKDVRVRQAFSLAIDRKLIVDSIVGSRPSNQMIPKGVGGFDEKLPVLNRDIEKAKQLIKDAGAVGAEVVLYAADGLYAKTNETLTVIAEQVSESGLKCTFKTMDTASFAETRKAGNYDCFFVGAASVAGNVNANLNSRIIVDMYKNGYRNDKLAELIGKVLITMDEEIRYNYIKQASTIVLEEAAPWTFIYQLENINAIHKGVSNVEFRGDHVTDLRWVKVE